MGVFATSRYLTLPGVPTSYRLGGILLVFFGSKPEEVVFLGDSNADIIAGKSAGVRTYAVQWLSTYQSTVYDVEPDAIFKNTSEFISILKDNGALS